MSWSPSRTAPTAPLAGDEPGIVPCARPAGLGRSRRLPARRSSPWPARPRAWSSWRDHPTSTGVANSWPKRGATSSPRAAPALRGWWWIQAPGKAGPSPLTILRPNPNPGSSAICAATAPAGKITSGGSAPGIWANTRASAFTSVVSAAEAPRLVVLLGATMSFRPPRCFRTASGTRTVSLCATPITPRPLRLRPAPPDPAPGSPDPPASGAHQRRPPRCPPGRPEGA